MRNDETLRAEIFQDVERCMPDNVYFRQPSTQNMLLDILFVFSKLNPDVQYRQGMHELLAPILWVVERDAIDPATLDDGSRWVEHEDVVRRTLDARYVQHDAFTLFNAVMQYAKAFYEPASQNAGMKNDQGRPFDASGTGESPLLLRCGRIFDSLLPTIDPALAAHLHDIGITPQIFLMQVSCSPVVYFC